MYYVCSNRYNLIKLELKWNTTHVYMYTLKSFLKTGLYSFTGNLPRHNFSDVLKIFSWIVGRGYKKIFKTQIYFMVQQNILQLRLNIKIMLLDIYLSNKIFKHLIQLKFIFIEISKMSS